jgi:filamentous hemagglutinin
MPQGQYAGSWGVAWLTSVVVFLRFGVFVGPGFTRSTRDPRILIGQDGLRQYRPPSHKPNLGRTQANFERRFEPGGKFNAKGHLDIDP